MFTALADDTDGGDTNKDGDQTQPRAGVWQGVLTAQADDFKYNEFTILRFLVIEHQGTLKASTTWLGNMLHRVVNDVVVPSGVTLTIGPGAIIKFDAGKGITVQSGGILIAQGQAALPVQFTSIRDDTLGGDTNGDGSQNVPQAGDWRWIYLDRGVGTFEYCILRYGGGPQEGGWGPAGGPGKSVIKTSGNAVFQFSQSQIVDGFYDGVLAWGGTNKLVNSLFVGMDRAICAHPGSVVEVLNCTLYDNRIGLLVHGGTLDAVNTIVAASLESGVQYDFGTLQSLAFCNVWRPTNTSGFNYRNTADLTGQNGNISIDPKFQNPQQLNFRLNYVSPCIDAANGTKAPPSDCMGAPRYDDPRSPNTGLPTPFANYADIGAYEFVESAQSDVDLVVVAVAGPTIAMAGELAWVEWTVQNIGAGEIKGPWHDAVYLVRTDNQELVPAQEVLVGQEVTLGPGQTYRARAEIRVPGGIMTDYQWQVMANSRGEIFEGEQSINNAGLSTLSMTLNLPELTMGGAPFEGRFTTAGEAYWLYLQPTPGKDVRISLDLTGEDGLTELYLGQGYLPSLTQFDARQMEKNAADTSLILSDTTANTYYVMVYARAMPSGIASFRLQASEVDFSINKVIPNTVGNAGQATVEIVSAKMRRGTRLSVVANGQRREAVRTRIFTSGKTYATFDLTGFPAGPADIEADQQGTVALGKGVLHIVTGGVGEFYAEISGPANLRLGRTGTWWITYGNRGQVDVPLPFLKFSMPGVQEIRLFDSTLNWAETFVLLALNDQAYLPTLGPGQEVMIEVEAKPGNAPTATAILGIIPGDQVARDTTRLDWQSIPAPPGVSPALWQKELDSLDQRIGRTLGDYYRLLLRDLEDIAAADLPHEYVANLNGKWLFGPESGGFWKPAPIIEVADPPEGLEIPSEGRPITALKIPGDGIKKTHFIVLAVRDYRVRNPDGKKDLDGCEKDAADLKEFATKDLRLPDNQCVQYVDDLNDANTLTKEAFINTIRSLVGKVDADDDVVIAYSGHGGRSPTGRGYLVMNTADPLGNVSPRLFQLLVDELGADRTYFINDSCHSGAFNEQIKPTKTRLIGLAATAADRLSWGNEEVGGRFTSTLKFHLRMCRNLQTAFDMADTLVNLRYQNQVDVERQQDPVLLRPPEVDLNEKPWGDSTRFPTVVQRQLLELATTGDIARSTTLPASIDPNDKIGPGGVGSEHYIGPVDWLPYTIRFENVTNATAPAQEVLVVDVLDTNLDWSTLVLAEVGFNDVKITIPYGFQNYSITNYVKTDPYPVIGEGVFDVKTGTLTWRIQSVDPITGELPEDPFAGFLPPNDSSHRGEGYVSFIVQPRSGLTNGTVIRNMATITFDPTYGANPPIHTPSVQHTIDAQAPISAVSPLAARSPQNVEVNWSGQDTGEGSGIANYDVYVSREAGAYQPWQLAVTNTSAMFAGEPGVTYAWISLARDRAGNVQSVPSLPHALTTTEFYLVRVSARRSGSGADALTAVTLAWQSAAGKQYHVWWTPNLGTAFARVATGLAATPPENTFTHPVAGSGPGYYLIEVSP